MDDISVILTIKIILWDMIKTSLVITSIWHVFSILYTMQNCCFLINASLTKKPNDVVKQKLGHAETKMFKKNV